MNSNSPSSCKATRLLALPLVLLLALSARADEAAMNAEIDYLLDAVAASDCAFIRNGKEHSAAEAGDHLQMKRRRGSRYYDSTEEFIERIASRSSWSGRDYQIRCGDEPTVTARAWFTNLLATYRRAAASAE